MPVRRKQGKEEIEGNANWVIVGVANWGTVGHGGIQADMAEEGMIMTMGKKKATEIIHKKLKEEAEKIEEHAKKLQQENEEAEAIVLDEYVTEIRLTHAYNCEISSSLMHTKTC